MGNALDVEPVRQLASDDPLLEEQGRRTDDLSPASADHLPDRRIRFHLGPCLGHEDRGASSRALLFELVEEETERGRDPIAVIRNGRQPFAQLSELLGRDQVAAGEDQVRLALEIGVDRADRQAGPTDDVLHRGPVEAMLGEDLDRCADDPVADGLFVLCAYPGHRPHQNEWSLAIAYSCRWDRRNTIVTFDD